MLASQAQSHARNASNAASSVAASNEHDLAASQFANAARDTDNPEAFRTLKLLEQHHEKLAELLKFRNSHPLSRAPEVVQESESVAPSPPSLNTSKPRESFPYPSPQRNPLLTHMPPRDVSSSIASNLASARGIPSNRQRRGGQTSSPIVPPNAEGKVLSPPRHSKIYSTSKSQHSPLPEQTQNPRQTSPTLPAVKSRDEHTPVAKDEPTSISRSDEPFQRFYATFETILSKISAPLAFAGLPLYLDEPSAKPPAPPILSQLLPERATAEPDYTKLFSKAALRAVREEHGPNGGGIGFGGAESFYVVPTTGGTISYADILARQAQQEANRHNNNTDLNSHEDAFDDEFVDARETPQPTSPVLTRGGRPKPGTKTMEELQLENSALRALADQFSKRLAEFEMGAQTSSLALQRSIRAMTQSNSLGLTEIGAAGGPEKMKALEEEVAGLAKEGERLGKENERLRGIVERYRERWQKLREGARARRDGNGKEEEA